MFTCSIGYITKLSIQLDTLNLFKIVVPEIDSVTVTTYVHSMSTKRTRSTGNKLMSWLTN